MLSLTPAFTALGPFICCSRLLHDRPGGSASVVATLHSRAGTTSSISRPHRGRRGQHLREERRLCSVLGSFAGALCDRLRFVSYVLSSLHAPRGAPTTTRETERVTRTDWSECFEAALMSTIAVAFLGGGGQSAHEVHTCHQSDIPLSRGLP